MFVINYNSEIQNHFNSESSWLWFLFGIKLQFLPRNPTFDPYLLKCLRWRHLPVWCVFVRVCQERKEESERERKKEKEKEKRERERAQLFTESMWFWADGRAILWTWEKCISHWEYMHVTEKWHKGSEVGWGGGTRGKQMRVLKQLLLPSHELERDSF